MWYKKDKVIKITEDRKMRKNAMDKTEQAF
jgi:hypothetical protein